MPEPRWQRVKALFEAVVEQPTSAREAFLATATGEDHALRREVESLLASDSAEHEVPGPLSSACVAVAALVRDDEPVAAQPVYGERGDGGRVPETGGAGERFGRYRVLELLGEGGMGSVWRAEQQHPIRRIVAVKVVRPGLDSRLVSPRIDHERQALAILNHPHIAKLFDAGVASDGRPYFVMELVEGSPITAFADEQHLTVRQRLELFLQVCDAVNHAHQRGVLHRDLKPGNVLVTQQDGRPVAKVIDFGISKAFVDRRDADASITESGMFVGTPAYMSPEQAGLIGAAVDTRTDIYSLGIVLYELLVGVGPFDDRDWQRNSAFPALPFLRGEEPPRLATRLRAQGGAAEHAARLRGTPLRRLSRQLRGDLEWITARAIQSAPSRRYESVAELGADTRRHIQGQPVTAGPPSTVYRLRKLARRHRAGAAAAAFIVLAVTLSAVVSTVALVRVLQAESDARRQLIASLVSLGMQKVNEGDALTAVLHFVRALELETDAGRARSHRVRIGETLQRAPRLVALWRHEGIHMLTLSSRGLVATGSADGSIEFHNITSGRPLGPGVQQGAGITAGDFSPDGAALAVGSENGHVRIWESSSGHLQRTFVAASPIAAIAWSPDGILLAAISEDGVVKVWDTSRGVLRFSRRHAGAGRCAVFSHRGALLATGGEDGVRLWHVASGKPMNRVLRHGRRGATLVAFSDDDAWLASGGWESSALLWDVRTSRRIGQVMAHDGRVTGVTFAAHSSVLVTTSIDRTTRIWRVPETSLVGTPRPSATAIQRPADVNSDLLIASPTQGGAVDVWRIDGMRPAPALPHGGQAMVRFESSGRFLVTASEDGLARVWDLAPAVAAAPRVVSDEGDGFSEVFASSDGRTAAVSTSGSPAGGAVRLWDIATGAPSTPAMRSLAPRQSVALSPDGRRLVTASVAGDVRLWDARTGEPLTPSLPEDIPVEVVAFSPDGQAFVVAGGTPRSTIGARVRRATDGAPVTALLSHDALEPVRAASFSPDGRYLLTAATGAGPNIKVWNPVTGRLEWSAVHGGVPTGAWSADGTLLFTGASDQWIRAWAASSGASRPPAIRAIGGISAIAAAADGAHLLAGTAAGDIRMVDLALGGQVVATMRERGYVYQTRFSHDGSIALTTAVDRAVRLWDGSTGEALSPNLAIEPVGRSAMFLGQGTSVAWGGTGVFVHDLSIDERPTDELRRGAEITAGRTISSSGVESALPPDDLAERFSTVSPSWRSVSASTVADYQRAKARRAWRRAAFEEVVAAIAPLAMDRALPWPDFVRLVGAYAATGRWQHALNELVGQHARWHAAPELLYMEAIARTQLHDEAGAVAICRAGLESTRGRRHPERAYWAARGCVVPATISVDDMPAVSERIDLAYPRMPGDLGQAELRGAMLLRTGRDREALNLLEAAISRDNSVPTAMLLASLAAARSGSKDGASKWLERAGTLPQPGGVGYLRPWMDAEAEWLRQEVSRALSGKRLRRPRRPER